MSNDIPRRRRKLDSGTTAKGDSFPTGRRKCAPSGSWSRCSHVQAPNHPVVAYSSRCFSPGHGRFPRGFRRNAASWAGVETANRSAHCGSQSGSGLAGSGVGSCWRRVAKSMITAVMIRTSFPITGAAPNLSRDRHHHFLCPRRALRHDRLKFRAAIPVRLAHNLVMHA
jgi:hypothetical protein